jgi:hypothetical protein
MPLGPSVIDVNARDHQLSGRDTGSESNRGDAAPVHDEGYPAVRSGGRSDLGPRVVHPAVAQVSAPAVPRGEDPHSSGEESSESLVGCRL